MTIDLNSLSLADLDALIRAGKKHQRLLANRVSIAKARKQIAAVAKRTGYTIDELFPHARGGAGKPRSTARLKKAKVPPKYRDPENPSYTWSGRGSMPNWLAKKIRFGHQAADFLIPGIARPTAAPGKRLGQRRLIKASEARATTA